MAFPPRWLDGPFGSNDAAHATHNSKSRRAQPALLDLAPRYSLTIASRYGAAQLLRFLKRSVICFTEINCVAALLVYNSTFENRHRIDPGPRTYVKRWRLNPGAGSRDRSNDARTGQG